MKPIAGILTFVALAGAAVGGFFLLKSKGVISLGAKGISDTTGTGSTTATSVTPAAEKSYGALIVQGDNYYKQASVATVDKQVALLNNAINRYNAALKFKPNDAVAKAKITEAEDSKPSTLELAKLRLKNTIANYKSTGRFANVSDAEFLIKNLDSLDESERPSSDEILRVLRMSNMAYYKGVVSPRMSEADMQKFIDSFAAMENGKRVIKHSGTFVPIVTTSVVWDYTPYIQAQLQKLLANGWWFGIKQNADPYLLLTPPERSRLSESEKRLMQLKRITDNMVNGKFVVYPFDLSKEANPYIQSSDGSIMHKINGAENYANEEYSYSFTGPSKKSSKKKINKIL